MAAISFRLAAIVALLSMLVIHGAHAQPSYNGTDDSEGGYYDDEDSAEGFYNGTQGRVLFSRSWLPARATWYGKPNGAGPDNGGGACGYSKSYNPPFNSMTSCGNIPIFKDGKGCGACYQVRCLSSKNRACSGQPQTIVITDVNTNSKISKYYFDMSGTSFGSMAKPGLNAKLRKAGIMDIQFRRVACNYKGLNVNFHVIGGSNPFYFAVRVEHAGGDGSIVQVDLKECNAGSWTPLRQSWGAIWRLDSGHPLKGPFSLRIRSDSGKILVAKNVIPANWKANKDYRSVVQFK
ncbi:hypothetical protein PR202_ga07793 [Eleusine coracana subsp. coracana]|uniref:Uncharacterized protein n=1 Tax=Eleusine coracana subsp. coracana TaxID=191504 RepID=A0AAV5BZN7_ELECO|nr:hypothetical protein QOZ80_2AG0116230 [Eleusine coracana subsp. coracana]GJM91427.1 hypothetical protein PR202_ga07793 [Eleusine coracana subsp. coracana]